MEGNGAYLRKASIHGLVGTGLIKQRHSEGEYCPKAPVSTKVYQPHVFHSFIQF